MTRFGDRYGPWAVVTGASSGIGEELARQLAARGLHLLLVARRTERLERLAAELSGAHGISARVEGADLGTEDGLERVRRAAADLDVGLLGNNAGFGLKGRFDEAPLERMHAMVALNCGATMALAHHFLGRFVARGSGGMILTSSTAAWQGTPWSAAYAATKAFGLLLAEATHEELRAAGVDVVALCPGPTDTEGPRLTGVDPADVPTGLMSPEPVVRAALEALGRRAVVVPGVTNRVGVLATRLVPRATTTRLAGRLMRRAMGSGR